MRIQVIRPRWLPVAVFLLVLVCGLPASSAPRAQEATGPAFPVKQFDGCKNNIYTYEVNTILLFFMTCLDSTGNEAITLWRSDGTTAGTEPLTTFASVPEGFVPIYLVSYPTKTKLFFWHLVGEASENKWQLWRSNGTNEGTFPLQTFSNLRETINIGDMLYFVVNKGYSTFRAVELWRSDGTIEGTILLKQLLIEEQPQSSTSPKAALMPVDPLGIHLIGELDNSLLIQAYTTDDYKLWHSNGTPESTTVIAQLPTGTMLYRIGPFNGKLLLRDSKTGRLWQTDGTTTGTSLLDIVAPPHGWILSTGTHIFYVDFTPDQQQVWRYQLWSTNGTEQCTFQIAQFPNTSTIENFSVGRNSTLFLVRYDSRLELWNSDGTQSGTTLVRELSGSLTVNSTVYNIENNSHLITVLTPLTQSSPLTILSLWRSDGTATGTTLIQDNIPAKRVIGVPRITEDAVYFWISDMPYARVSTLWKLPRSAIVPNAEITPTPNPEIGAHKMILPLVVDQC